MMKIINALYIFGISLVYQPAYCQVLESSIDTSNMVMGCSLEPQFVGGFDSLNAYLSTHLFEHKSLDFKKEGLIGGRVWMRCIVEIDGSLSHTVLETNLPNCEPCNEEAIRVVMSMPKWIPVSIGGKAVRTYVRFPINFAF